MDKIRPRPATRVIVTMAAKKKKTGEKTRATLPGSKKRVSAKIRKIKKHHPEWSHKKQVAVALEMVRKNKD